MSENWKYAPGAIVDIKKGMTVCNVTLSHLGFGRLIAAAPDLLEALQRFVSEYVELVESGDAGFWDAEKEEKVIKARAAIAKAEGG